MPDWIIVLLGKTPELASVVVVVFFALKMNENSRKSAESIMKDWRGFLEDQNIKWQAFINMQEDKWRQFVEAQSANYVRDSELAKESHNAAIARLAEEIKMNSIKMAETNALLLGRLSSSSQPMGTGGGYSDQKKVQP